jgi:hypothetical protein
MSELRAARNSALIIPLHRPQIVRERNAEAWIVVLPNGHGWLAGDRRQALAEFSELERIERRGKTP